MDNEELQEQLEIERYLEAKLNGEEIIIPKERYYYKSKNGNNSLSLSSPFINDDYVEITEEQFNALQPQPHEPSEEELARKETINQIAILKKQLADTDYQAIKYAEGWLSEEEYAPIKAQRQEWRTQINELEETL